MKKLLLKQYKGLKLYKNMVQESRRTPALSTLSEGLVKFCEKAIELLHHLESWNWIQVVSCIKIHIWGSAAIYCPAEEAEQQQNKVLGCVMKTQRIIQTSFNFRLTLRVRNKSKQSCLTVILEELNGKRLPHNFSQQEASRWAFLLT